MTDHVSAPISTTINTQSLRILRLPEVIRRVGLRRASIYLHISKGSFPKPISLGARAVGWLESKIDGWIGRIRAVNWRVDSNVLLQLVSLLSGNFAEGIGQGIERQ